MFGKVLCAVGKHNWVVLDTTARVLPEPFENCIACMVECSWCKKREGRLVNVPPETMKDLVKKNDS